MKIKKISYISPQDLTNACIDVLVVVEDDKYSNEESPYVVEVTTPQFLLGVMEKFKSDFLEPSYPFIIVSKLTDEIIKSASNRTWMKKMICIG